MRRKPQTIDPAINGLVGLLSAHQSYLKVLEQAHRDGLPLPAAPDPLRLAQSAQALQALTDSVAHYGDEREQVMWECFTGEPETHEEIILTVLGGMAARETAFAEHVRALAEQTGTVSARHYAGFDESLR